MGEIIAVSSIDKQIILMKAEGMPSKQIADYLNLTQKAVERRIDKLIEKFDCSSSLHLYKRMKDRGYI